MVDFGRAGLRVSGPLRRLPRRPIARLLGRWADQSIAAGRRDPDLEEEERLHVHVLGEEGEAKVWIEPRIEVARNHGLTRRTLGIALDLIEEREDEIRRAWNEHFGG